MFRNWVEETEAYVQIKLELYEHLWNNRLYSWPLTYSEFRYSVGSLGESCMEVKSSN